MRAADARLHHTDAPNGQRAAQHRRAHRNEKSLARARCVGSNTAANSAERMEKNADAARAPNVTAVTLAGSSVQRVAEVTTTAGLPLHDTAR
jgi:hypothetical protein